MNDQPQIQQAPAPQIDVQNLLAENDELQAMLSASQQRCVLLNREIRSRDQQIQELSQQVAEKTGFGEGVDAQPPQED